MPPTRTTTATPIAATADDDLALNIKAFGHHLAAERKSRKTIDIYQGAAHDLEAFLRRMGMPLAVANIRREHLAAYLEDLRDRVTQRGTPTSPATMNQFYRSLQAFFRYLIAEDEIRESPLRNIAPPNIPETNPHIVSQDEMRALLRACDGPGFEERRDTAILTFLYDSGVRLGELTGLAVDDLDTDAREATVTGKYGRPRIVRFQAQTIRTIDRYLKLRNRHPHAADHALWIGQKGALTENGVMQLINRRARQAGVTGVHAHAFRHAFAHNFLEAGGQEGDLMHLAGWKSRAMVDRYGRTEAAARARRNYDPFSPMERLRRNDN